MGAPRGNNLLFAPLGDQYGSHPFGLVLPIGHCRPSADGTFGRNDPPSPQTFFSSNSSSQPTRLPAAGARPQAGGDQRAAVAAEALQGQAERGGDAQHVLLGRQIPSEQAVEPRERGCRRRRRRRRVLRCRRCPPCV